MHWLQSLDIALFHFANGALVNPFFDWLMPRLSGYGVPWLPAVVVAVPALLIWGSPRLKICALMLVLVVAIGDGGIVNHVKKSVLRPRPYVTLLDARLYETDSETFKVGAGYMAPLPDGSLPAKANRRSFPSAHAANWFALAAVALFFYRRSAWFMYPLACGVAFSRLYVGVHYPSDLLAGAILGTGYAIALMFIFQWLWRTVGKKLFPAWQARLPNLLNPDPSPKALDPRPKAASGQRPAETEWLRLGYLVIVVALVARCLYLASGLLNLSGDEAYQWLWSKHLALSYFSKSPGIAYIQWTGTSLFGDTELGVRFFSPVFAAILSFFVLRFMAGVIGARNAFLLLLATLATPLLVAGSILMTVDPPLVLCWMWAVVAGWRAVQPEGRTRDWLMVGVALGLGFLSKYSMLFLPVCLGIYFILQPSARPQLRRPGPWLALGLLALSAVPVIIWNAQHGWITVQHVVAGNAHIGGANAWHPTLRFFGEFLGAEFGLLNPIFFLAMLWACFAFWKRRKEKPILLYLFCLGGPVFFGYWLFTFHSRVLPNWIAPAVPPLFCLMAIYWSERRWNFKPWFIAALVIGIIASAVMYDSDLVGKVTGHKLPGDADPLHRARGWREAARVVDKERAAFDTNAFVIADDYSTTGLYSFYSPAARAAATTPTPLVYCISSDHPDNQFYFWDEYNYEKHRRGQNAIYVRDLSPYKLESGWVWKWLKGEPVDYAQIPPPRPVDPRIADEFESVTNLGIFEIRLDDRRIFHRLQIFGCYHLK